MIHTYECGERERERSREKMISFQKGADGKIPDNAHIYYTYFKTCLGTQTWVTC